MNHERRHLGERTLSKDEAIHSITKSVYEHFSDREIDEKNITRQKIAAIVSNTIGMQKILTPDEQVEIYKFVVGFVENEEN